MTEDTNWTVGPDENGVMRFNTSKQYIDCAQDIAYILDGIRLGHNITNFGYVIIYRLEDRGYIFNNKNEASEHVNKLLTNIRLGDSLISHARLIVSQLVGYHGMKPILYIAWD